MKRNEHLLVILAEECAEVAQKATKALRFGLSDIQPNQNQTNEERLLTELDDLYTVVQLLVDSGSLSRVGTVSQYKSDRVEYFLGLSAKLGTLK